MYWTFSGVFPPAKARSKTFNISEIWRPTLLSIWRGEDGWLQTGGGAHSISTLCIHHHHTLSVSNKIYSSIETWKDFNSKNKFGNSTILTQTKLSCSMMMWVIMSLHLFQLGILPFICLVHIITPNTIHYLSPSPSDPCPLSCDQAPLLMSLWQMLCTVQSQKQQQTNYRSLCPPPSSLSFILSLLSLPPICGHRRGWGCKWAKTKKISIFSSIWNWDQR